MLRIYEIIKLARIQTLGIVALNCRWLLEAGGGELGWRGFGWVPPGRRVLRPPSGCLALARRSSSAAVPAASAPARGAESSAKRGVMGFVSHKS